MARAKSPATILLESWGDTGALRVGRLHNEAVVGGVRDGQNEPTMP